MRFLSLAARPDVVSWLVLLAAFLPGRLSAQTSKPCSRATRFAQCYVLRDSITLFQDLKTPIVRIAAVEVSTRGEIIVADPSEAHVKVFRSNGSLLRVLGRKGEGPGEFFQPSGLRLTKAGQLHVLDPRVRRVSVFDAQYKFLRTIRLPDDIGFVTAMAVDSLGQYYLAGIGSDGIALVRADSTGRLLKKYLMGSRGTRDPDKMWRVLLYVFLATAERSVYLVSAVQDSLYVLDTATETISAIPIPAKELAARPAPPKAFERQSFATWADSFFRPEAVFSSEGEIVIPVVRGNLFEGAKSVLAALDGNTWHTLAGAPPILAASHGRLVAVLNPDPDRIVIGIFRKRP